MTSLRDLWEAEAPAFATWARAPGHDSYVRFHRDQFLPFLPEPGRRTLDIGCGEGRVSRDLKALGHTVEGVDASATMVALAREAASGAGSGSGSGSGAGSGSGSGSGSGAGSGSGSARRSPYPAW
ncbi:MAG: methyltransferase domain-containing protein [Polyangiaceae bacterium]|nr:methyltransferase domain-containing protein [Polyangiaceae bacterium]